MPRVSVAVVGTGISGAACARALEAADLDVVVLDRGRRAGGRMAVRTFDDRPVDTGASYLTTSDKRFGAVVDGWLRTGLARPWTDRFHVAGPSGLGRTKAGPTRYGAPAGLRSLVLDLLADVEVTQLHEVRHVGPGPTLDGTSYDAVVLAMPDPQAERLLDDELTQEREAVRGRAWEPVLALAAGFADRRWDHDFDGCFVNDSPALGWIADDGRRRGDDAAVLVAHSTSAFAEEWRHDPDSATEQLLAATQAVLHVADRPSWTFVQRWGMARPAGPRDAPFHLGASGVGLCGDGWGIPKVEGAWLSGHLLGTALAQQLS